MIAENVLGRLTDEGFKHMKVCYVDVDWYNANKKIQMLTTQSGVEIGVRLSEEAAKRGLSQDDIIAVIDESAVAVNIKESPCISVVCHDFGTTAKVCYEIGNRHAPLFYGGENEIVMPYDKPMFEMLTKLNVAPCIKTMKIHMHKSISNSNVASHDHHKHDHDHHGHSHTE